ncbi:MAG: hypothetical protein KDA84_28105 [Planctomycetaceae bacterium]|nr:hypothetical protein [Planctomycetaceae bacterium]
MLFLFLGSYVVSYIALSAFGEYRPSPSGKRRYAFGLAVMDRSLWQPKGMYWSRRLDLHGESTTEGSLLGYLYFPLIVVDRTYWHPTMHYFEE